MSGGTRGALGASLGGFRGFPGGSQGPFWAHVGDFGIPNGVQKCTKTVTKTRSELLHVLGVLFGEIWVPCDPENDDFVWEGMHGFAFRPFHRSMDLGAILGAKMMPFGGILVAEMTSKKQPISRRARGVPWEGSWGIPCGTRGFRGEPRSESTCI